MGLLSAVRLSWSICWHWLWLSDSVLQLLEGTSYKSHCILHILILETCLFRPDSRDHTSTDGRAMSEARLAYASGDPKSARLTCLGCSMLIILVAFLFWDMRLFLSVRLHSAWRYSWAARAKCLQQIWSFQPIHFLCKTEAAKVLYVFVRSSCKDSSLKEPLHRFFQKDAS